MPGSTQPRREKIPAWPPFTPGRIPAAATACCTHRCRPSPPCSPRLCSRDASKAGPTPPLPIRLRPADLNLSYTRVTAPVSGVAGRMARSEGSLVTAGQDSSLLTTMNQVDPIWVRFSLSESDLAKLPDKRLDRIKSAEVRLALPDGSRYPLAGRLNFAATQIDPRLATQELRAEFSNPGVRLLPGQFVRVQVAAGERDNVFLVPQTAVIQTEKTFLVFTLDKENKA